MEYNYLPERQESHTAPPESSRVHPQSQYPVHCEHQQYPTRHQVLPAGYPGLGFGSYIPHIQGLGTASVLESQDGCSTSVHFRQETPHQALRAAPVHSHLPNLEEEDFHVSQPAVAEISNVTSKLSTYTSHTSSGSDEQPENHSSNNPCAATSNSHQEKLPSKAFLTKDSSNDASTIRVLKPLGHIPDPVEKDEVNTKACQTVPLFEELPEAEESMGNPVDIPEGLSYIELSGREEEHFGVMVTKDFEAGEEFGPVTGELVKDELGMTNPSTWEICVRGRTRFYISGGSGPNNWMSHVRLARCREEQNLEAFQFYGDIFFRTTKAVEKGTELRVFYSRDYRERAGFQSDLEDLSWDREWFHCNECGSHYTNAKSLLRHGKFEHNKENAGELFRGKAGMQANERSRLSEILVPKKRHRNVPTESHSALKKNESEAKSKSLSSSKHLRVKFVTPKKTRECSVRVQKLKATLPFVCDVCKKQFLSEGLLMAHAAFHIQANIGKPVCGVCGISCKNMRVKSQHEISHDPNAYRCHICQKYFRRKGCIILHLRRDHSMFMGKKWGRINIDDLLNKPQNPDGDGRKSKAVSFEEKGEKKWHRQKLTCTECSQSFKDAESFEVHSCCPTSTPGTFKCQYCDMVFSGNSNLIGHLREKHEIRVSKKRRSNMEERFSRLIRPEDQSRENEQFHPDLPKDMLGRCITQSFKKPKMFKCKYCPSTFRNFNHVLKHEKQTHTYTGDYMCEFCSAVFVKEMDYLFHKRKHTKDHPFKCKECPLSFASESARENHMSEHRGERPVSCDACGKGFRTRKLMLSHRRRMHAATPSAPHACRFCPSRFRDRNGLKRHENRHRGVRPYVCDQCGKAFRVKYNLQCHTLIHTGEKPHECRECKKRFRLNHQLVFHMICHERDRKKAEGRRRNPSSDLKDGSRQQDDLQENPGAASRDISNG